MNGSAICLPSRLKSSGMVSSDLPTTKAALNDLNEAIASILVKSQTAPKPNFDP
jgi:hypothetical protein